MCATILGWRCRVKMPFLLPWTRVTPCAVMKSAKFHRCSPMKKRAARSRSNVPKYCVGVRIGVRVRGQGQGSDRGFGFELRVRVRLAH